MNHHYHDTISGTVPPHDDFVEMAHFRRWPDGLLERMVALRLPSWLIAEALSDTYANAVELLEANVSDRERLSTGLVVREATWEDDERLIALFGNSTERLDDWDVVVDRSPNPFAQQRLQENAQVKLLVDQGTALGVAVQSGRNTILADRRVSVVWIGGWRIRDGLRRNRYSTLLLNSPGSASGVLGVVTYWYVRVANEAAQSWISNAVTAEREATCASERCSVTVYHLDSSQALGSDDAIAGPVDQPACVRRIRPNDVNRCVDLINRTHRGFDLFRPYTAEFLESRMQDGYWGPRPQGSPPVYGWDDMVVVEQSGRIVACGGGWDRGRDVRERWRHRITGEQRTIDNVCLMDWGYEVGHNRAMVAVAAHHLRRAKQLGRTSLAVPFQHHPDILAALGWAKPEPEVRLLEALATASCGTRIDAAMHRPYTDLAYW